jgi:hypothetical protein
MVPGNITKFLKKAASLDTVQVHALATSWDRLWHDEDSNAPDALAAARAAAVKNGRDWEGVKKQSWHVVFSSDWTGTGYSARRGISDVAGALLVHDLISSAQFSVLCEPWKQTIGRIS